MNIEVYENDLEDILEQDDFLSDEEYNKLCEDWNYAKEQFAIINEKYKDKDFFRDKALAGLKKKFLNEYLKSKDDETKTKYYALILEYLGIDSYLLGYELSNLSSNARKK